MLELPSLFCCGNFVGPTDFGSPTVKTVGLLEQQKSYNKWGIITSNTNSFHLLRDKKCRSNKRCERGTNKWLKSQTNTNSFQLLGVQNCCITTLFPNKSKKGLLDMQSIFSVSHFPFWEYDRVTSMTCPTSPVYRCPIPFLRKLLQDVPKIYWS